ncbi:MAG TPA: DUF3147 family protein [Burkholderiales bacterium]|jgi:hypothetical protein|nr:DUF3147 family protein [Burkholderiales bacterium]
MGYYAVKVLVSAVLIVLISEIAKRNTFFGALIASLPVTSLLAFIWLYLDTGNTARIAALSTGVFWLVLPSLAFFVVLPVALRAGWTFWPSLLAAISTTVACYAIMVPLLRKFGIEV